MRRYSTQNQSGFAAIEAVLVLVIVGIIGGTGYFVWHAKQNADKALANTANSQPGIVTAKKTDKKSDTKTTTATDETASWLLYEPPGKEYSIRLADGWKLEHYIGSSSIYALNNSDLAPVPGTKATVTTIEGGKDGRTGLFLNYSTQNLDQIVTDGEKQTSLKTADGLEVEKYYEVTNNPSDAMGAGPQNDDKQYRYVIHVSSKAAFTVNYSFQPTHVDYHETVEKVLKTVHFN